MSRIVYIYSDEGASYHSVSACQYMLQTYTPYPSATINAENLIEGSWRNHAAALIIPGGADIPYGNKLNGLGNQQLRDYVHQGGHYIGLCAGAYYASAMCDFHRDDLLREVIGPRELAFYPGSAVGPTLAPYTYDSELGACIANVQWDNDIYSTYYNGGCHFPDANQYDHITALAYYANDVMRITDYEKEKQPAVILCQVGRGKALLSGVHPEYSVRTLKDMSKMYAGNEQKVQTIHRDLMPNLKDNEHIQLFMMMLNRLLG